MVQTLETVTAYDPPSTVRHGEAYGGQFLGKKIGKDIPLETRVAKVTRAIANVSKGRFDAF